MKRLLFILLCVFMSTTRVLTDENPQHVYICTSPNAYAYHLSKRCASCNCSKEVREVSLEYARKKGRVPCKRCCY